MLIEKNYIMETSTFASIYIRITKISHILLYILYPKFIMEDPKDFF